MSDPIIKSKEVQNRVFQFYLELSVMRATLPRDQSTDINALKAQMQEVLDIAHSVVQDAHVELTVLIQMLEYERNNPKV